MVSFFSGRGGLGRFLISAKAHRFFFFWNGRVEEMDLSGRLEEMLRDLTRECLRVQPRDLERFCLGYFSATVSALEGEEREMGDTSSSPSCRASPTAVTTKGSASAVAATVVVVQPGLRGEPEHRSDFFPRLEKILQGLTHVCLLNQPNDDANLQKLCREYFQSIQKP